MFRPSLQTGSCVASRFFYFLRLRHHPTMRMVIARTYPPVSMSIAVRIVGLSQRRVLSMGKISANFQSKSIAVLRLLRRLALLFYVMFFGGGLVVSAFGRSGVAFVYSLVSRPVFSFGLVVLALFSAVVLVVWECWCLL